MTPERWQLAERIFHEAVEHPSDQRAAFVESRCGEDKDLKREVEAGFRAQLMAGMSETPTGMSEAEVSVLRAAYRSGGQRALYRKRVDLLLAKLKPETALAPQSASHLADAYAHLGDRDQTLFWLRQSTDLHGDEALLLMAHIFDFLRQDQAFTGIEKRVGFVR